MNNTKTAERMILKHQGRLIDTRRAVRACEKYADDQARALQKVMLCYDPKRCSVGVRCGECGR